jgi:carbon-monoxide dehydrogenase iron sulfur subunit
MSELIETILVDTRSCTGCLACELACGYHWSGEMDPSRSTIYVRRDDTSGLIDIKIFKKCDTCPGIETPMCVSVCTPRALTLGRRRARTGG